jgi:hypothetical protein
MSERIEPTRDVPGTFSDTERFVVRGALLNDMLTHRTAWRLALLNTLATADREDVLYWEHALDALDRVSAKLEQRDLNPQMCDGCSPEVCGGCGIPWTGCGSCDPAFDCYNGEARCSRLPLKEKP